jgi:glycine oxidase
MKIAVVGAGSAGLFSAWYLSRLHPDLELHVLDARLPGSGATRAAAGMLAPINELEFQEIPLLKAGQASLRLYLEEVEPSLGESAGIIRGGTLELPLTRDDVGYLQRLYDFQIAQGLPVKWLTGDEIQAVEPLVSPEVRHAIWAADDIQVDPLRLVESLLASLLKKGAQIHTNTRVHSWELSGEKVDLGMENGTLMVDKALIATGVTDAETVKRLPFRAYPVRGERITLKTMAGLTPKATIRIRSLSYGNAYIVPKKDRVVLGSTSEERGFKLANTAGGMLDILRKCYAVLPSLYELEFEEAVSGLRPSTLDRMPVLDQQPGAPVFYLNGLYRHGILLGPLMGKSAASLMMHGTRLPETQSFQFPAF